MERRICLATVPAGFADAVYVSGIGSNATSMAFAPDGRLFITLQGGQLRVVKRTAQGTAQLNATPFLTVTTDSSGERGLLGVAPDPNFQANGYVYVYYTVPQTPRFNRISRFTAADADPDPNVYAPGDTVAAGSEAVLMNLNPLSSATNHNGGALNFGPDGKLYVSVGENANPSNAQSLATRLGKVLRLNPDPAEPIPTDNPFYSTATGDNRAIWALGLRNPYTFAFQPGTGRMFINDVGDNGAPADIWEEINEGGAGRNYGWPNTGDGYFNQTQFPSFTNPLHAYNHSTGAAAITGGTFYNPAVQNFPSSYLGDYFFADYGGGFIRKLEAPETGSQLPSTGFATGINQPVDLDVGPDGQLYYLARGSGTVGRIRSTVSLAPTISTQPTSMTAITGNPATFSVAATGEAPLSYRWQRADPGGEFADIAGATEATYTLQNAADADNGDRFRVVVTNAFGSVTSDEAVLTVRRLANAVAHYVFYNDSAFDGGDPAANAADSGAIATDKQPLLPMQTATFANVTSYSKGINGVMVDVDTAGIDPRPEVNFGFSVGTGDPVTWSPAPAPSATVMLPGAGVNGSDRYLFTWPDGAIKNAWLGGTATIVANGQGVIHDTFWFGNLVGETGDDESAARVNAVDLSRVRAAQLQPAPITSPFDFNRDGRVNAVDLGIARAAQLSSIPLITAPPPPPGAALAVQSVWQKDPEDLLA